ncbi:hypothetical protein E2542_SST18608 [Spatholobus suberectus]|nr:hypothetical protein E2542_SST18608 [Spatholobus suberectus]
MSRRKPAPIVAPPRPLSGGAVPRGPRSVSPSISQIAPRGAKPTLDLTLSYSLFAVPVQRLRDQKQEEEESDSRNKQGEQQRRCEKGEEKQRRRRRHEGSVVAPIALEEARRGRKSCGVADVALLWIRLRLSGTTHFYCSRRSRRRIIVKENSRFCFRMFL